MTQIKLSALVLAIFATVGCTKTNSDQMEHKTEAQVSFVTEINGSAQVASKATTPLVPNTEVLISASLPRASTLPGQLVIRSKPYQVTATELTPIEKSPHSSTQMFLPLSSYEFASVAINDGATSLVEKSGGATGVEQYYGVSSGFDYIGAVVGSRLSNASITDPIRLVFNHLAAQIELTLIKDEATVDVLDVAKVEITPTQRLSTLTTELSGYLCLHGGGTDVDPFVKIDEANIEVAPIAMLVPMTPNGLVFSHIVLPSSRTGDLKMRITGSITLAGQATPIAKVYEVTVPVSAASPIVAGKRHSYKATISASGITFNGVVDLADWVSGNGAEGEDLGFI